MECVDAVVDECNRLANDLWAAIVVSCMSDEFASVVGEESADDWEPHLITIALTHVLAVHVGCMKIDKKQVVRLTESIFDQFRETVEEARGFAEKERRPNLTVVK